ncbi:phospholipase B1, membrane-associated-like [Branchiostoma floridae x Branchiostoma belcheri]
MLKFSTVSNMKFLVIAAALVATAAGSDWKWQQYKEALEHVAAAEQGAASRWTLPAVGFSGFGCPVQYSSTTPTSVHQLRPSDIDVVAALGDSITAANGALASNVLEVLTEYRGASWSIGGDGSLESTVTLANIIKKFNPNVKGFSMGTGDVFSIGSKFNVAYPGKEAIDMPGQADDLITRLQNSADVDYENDWKVITLFIGGNDLCAYCDDKNLRSPANYQGYIRQALDKLHAQVPRAYVNLVNMLDIAELNKGQLTFTCRLLSAFLCNCVTYADNTALNEIRDVNQQYQNSLIELVGSGRYDTRDDFTVVLQPFFENTPIPLSSSGTGEADLSYFAPDCFHFSGKAHAEAAEALWMNMLEGEGQKSKSWRLGRDVSCPSSTHPYLRTRLN